MRGHDIKVKRKYKIESELILKPVTENSARSGKVESHPTFS